jgi:hypothetical protein
MAMMAITTKSSINVKPGARVLPKSDGHRLVALMVSAIFDW